jgi:hypothetical protein
MGGVLPLGNLCMPSSRAYTRGLNDPRLLAVIGLLDCDVGDDADAKAFLEAAVQADVAGPQANGRVSLPVEFESRQPNCHIQDLALLIQAQRYVRQPAEKPGCQGWLIAPA